MNLADLNPLAAIGSKLIDRFLPDPVAADKAKAELAQMQENGELARMANETDLYKTEQNNLTDRLKADMGSDSWLSKNIRPMTLIFILLAYFIFAMMSAYGMSANEKYVELLGQWGMLIMSFYFGGRTLEKIMDMKAKK
jgi:Na+-transporting methylmalonyl-CoA/oxaloacetate decarboxylase gamma subunit